MKRYQITPERKAHLYALMAWSDQYTKEQAEEIAYTTEYEELNNITYAEDSITTAVNGLSSMISAGRLVVPAQNTDSEWDMVIKILIRIHNKWVEDNAKKYNRGNDEKSNKNLFQHLPTSLIGIDELAKDLMFLAPFLEEIGLNAGEMNLIPYGMFKPSKELIEAYNRHVEKYKRMFKIDSLKQLAININDCIDGFYISLKPQNEEGLKRIDYMKRHVGLLVQSVVDKNPECFGMLPMSSDIKF